MPLHIPEWSGQCPTAKGYPAKMSVAAEAEVPHPKSRVEMNPFHGDLMRLLCALGQLGLP